MNHLLKDKSCAKHEANASADSVLEMVAKLYDTLLLSSGQLHNVQATYKRQVKL